MEREKNDWVRWFPNQVKECREYFLDVWDQFLNHTEDTYRSAAFVLCWKMISYLPQADVVRRNSRNDHATRFSDLMLPYVRANLLPHKNAIEYEVFKTNLARHTECLKFVSNSQLR